MCGTKSEGWCLQGQPQSSLKIVTQVHQAGITSFNLMYVCSVRWDCICHLIYSCLQECITALYKMVLCFALCVYRLEYI